MIRLATKEDEEQLLHICYKFFLTTNHNDLTWDRQKVITLIRSFTGEQGKIFLIAEDEYGNIISCLAGFIIDHLFATNKIAYEILWYVDQEFKRSKDVIKILKAYELWAKKSGCTHLSMGNRRGVDDSKEDALERYYLRNGFKIIETVYKKKL